MINGSKTIISDAIHFDALVFTDNLPHKEWLEYRRLGIGGSDASVVCGINRWKSPIELWMEKTGQFPLQDTSITNTPSESAYWGNRLQSLVEEEFTLRTGIEVIAVNAILQSKEYPFMLANLDGICLHPEYGEVIFEAKTTGAYRSGEWSANNAANNYPNNACEDTPNSSYDNSNGNGDGVPPEHILQLQHYMAVTGARGAYIAVLIGGNSFKWQFVERDEELIAMLIKLEAEFWDRVQSNIPPALDGSDASAKFLKERFPDSIPESTIELPDDALSLIGQYHFANDKVSYYTEQKQEAENLLKQMMGDNEVGIVRGGNGIGFVRNDGDSYDGYNKAGDSYDGYNKAANSADVDLINSNGSGNGSSGNDGGADSSATGDIIITWKSFTQERLDTKAIKSDHPTLCKKYEKTISSRRFSIKAAVQN